MAQTQALDTLLEHELAARDQALGALGRAEDAARAAQAKVEQLVGYRDEYRQRWAAQFGHLQSIEIVRHYQAFMTRLNQAVSLQQAQAQKAAEQVERARALLIERERAVASVRKLLERRQQQAQQAAQRQDQKQTDETAARLAWRAARDAGLRVLL